MNLFHRHPGKPTEENPPLVEPPPVPEETRAPVKITSISLSALQEAQLTHALRPKVARVLKDLAIGGIASEQVVGGASTSSSPSPRSVSPNDSAGPIV